MNDDDDFASAAMLRLIRLGLARQGLAMPTVPPPPAPAVAPAHIGFAHKRALADALLARYGPEVMWRIGEAVLDAPDEPTLTALVAASDPPDLVRRFQRLERYIHSRHQVVVEIEQPGHLQLRHRSTRADAPPRPAEDLLVWGLLKGLLQRLGTPALRTGLAEGTAVLELRWQPQPLQARTPSLAPADTPAAARRALATDLGADWTLPRLAATLGLSLRTLQRRLAEGGSSFARLWTEVRLAAAGHLLTEGADSTAQVGYHCGFADQAHFTRCFQRHMAITPARYRREFGRAPALRVSPSRGAAPPASS